MRKRAVRGRVVRGQVVRERVVRERAVCERVVRERAVRERVVRERAVRERAVRERVVRERVVRERVVRERVVRERAVRERAVRERFVRPLASTLRLLIYVLPLLTSAHPGLPPRFLNSPLALVPRWHSHDDYDRKGAEWLHFLLDARKQKPGYEVFSGYGALDFELLAKASSSMPNASYHRMDQSFDITGWLAPHIAKGIKQHTKVLRWNYTRNKEGQCLLLSRQCG